jgi:hypothetical protein
VRCRFGRERSKNLGGRGWHPDSSIREAFEGLSTTSRLKRFYPDIGWLARANDELKHIWPRVMSTDIELPPRSSNALWIYFSEHESLLFV